MMEIHPVAETQIQPLCSVLREHGAIVVQIEKNKFHIEGHGISSNAVYNPEKQQLIIEVLQKPFYVSKNMIVDGLRDELNKITV